MPPAIPAELHDLMAQVGPRWGTSVQAHVKLMVQRFSEVLEHAPKEATVTRNQAYGDHPRQCLDVYEPLDQRKQRPIVMFIHGGAFVDGDKDRTSEIYSNVLWYFARFGVVGVNVEFRLAPEFGYPSGTQDIAAAVAWVRAHAHEFGGDASRIFLMGHSAGAAHAGHYAYDRSFHPADGPGIAGLVVVSGRVRAENSAENPNASRVEAYYGNSLAFMTSVCAISHVAADSVPTMIAVAEFENPLIDVHCVELLGVLTRLKRRAPPFVWLAKHNHTSIVGHFNTEEDLLGRQILDFIDNPR